mmetsp:Transcript_30521/g.58768  ORF Transcript_30521/g.58768 Transcript_30521/m.58768 type:complete len:312 (-) Transcript_30521:178-1113(-)|eukprot:CAMPEP_0114225016 /NCGR_PEP_ID=MMETSP0058-20121206/428_1 /TAXON_ID=36894 /ORGANISM="Pyramimonas parkeae, CCMP726" /LENGTH=311 /DNA_ID=CAMNT_0001335555 /DNA_START=57 /DNA_END=992 /DNA_ORIENTATION=+
MAPSKESAGSGGADGASGTPVQDVVSSFTRLSKAFLAVLLGGWLLVTLVPSLKPFLTLVPGKTLPCVWNVVTAGYIETSFWMLLLNGCALLILARYLEPIWGSKEFLQFIVVINAAVGVLTFMHMMTVYFATSLESYLYGQANGFHGVVAGFMVAIKQAMPEHEVRILGILRFRLKQLPFLLLLVVSLVYITLDVDLVTFSVLGTFCSWVYLRFYQERSNGSKGDMSDAFAFSSFFPVLLQPVIDNLTTPIHKILCPGHSAIPYSLGAGPLPGSDTSEAQRRRERGARALEERLNAAARENMKAGNDVESA